jgi:predicted  nucleic acid-binding Zn-ribbon protein
MEPQQIQKTEKVLVVSKKKFLWTVFILLVLAAIVLFVWVRSMNSARMGTASSMKTPPLPPGYTWSPQEGKAVPQYFNQGNGTISDMREFMKVSYSGNIKTHDVRDTMREARSIIRDADGRIDNENINDRYASIRFVIPKKNFEEFQDDMSENFNTKLYTESTTSENLLSEKQSIEERVTGTQDALATAKEEQAALKKAHNARVASLNSRIGTIQSRLTTIRSGPLSDPSTPSQYRDQLQEETATLSTEENTLRSQLQSENADYSNKNSALADQIASYEEQLKGLTGEGQEFVEKIETVEGTVTANFTSYWGIFKEFSPVHPTIIVIVLALVLFRILQKVGILPIIRFA